MLLENVKVGCPIEFKYSSKIINYFKTPDVVIVISAVTTYIYLFLKIRILGRSLTNDATRPSISAVWLKLKIPTLMILTFIVFNVSASIMASFFKTDDTFDVAFYLLEILGWISDAIIYTFLQKSVRELLVSWFRKPPVEILPIQMN